MGQVHYHLSAQKPAKHPADGPLGPPGVVCRCERLILAGEASRAALLLAGLPPSARTRRVRRLLGDAWRAAGRLDRALAAYDELVPRGAAAVPPDLAWRMARVHLERREHGPALDVLDRVAPGGGDADRALLEAARATAYWMRGEPGPAQDHAESSHRVASRPGDRRALAAAHVALALAGSLRGQPDAVLEHYRRAAAHAADVGDLLLLARIDANLSHHLLADARYREAAEAAHDAAEAAARLAAADLESVALENEAEALVRLGRLDAAADRYQRVLGMAGRLGTARTAGALAGLSQVHARRGEHEQERADLEVAHRLTAGCGADREVRMLVLTSLARALIPVDPDRARRLATEARAAARGSSVLPALLASSRVALAAGDLATAARDAAEAVAHAGHRRERGWLAEALELRAETDPDRQARAALREAHGIWERAQARHDADRVLVRLATLAGATPADRVAGRVAAARSAARGLAGPTPEPGVVISTFGRFEVHVAGAPVPAQAWQSRRARDLLRILVAGRGRAIPRLVLSEALWPDEEPGATAHRLSVLLSIVRGVLGADALVADRECVALDPGEVLVDVEEFLDAVTDAAQLHRQGATDEARVLLTEALHRRTDEPFADTPYDDATLALREDAHAAYVQALRLMALLCRSTGDHDEAAAWLRRLLAAEPYDEDAHLTLAEVLAAGGRHGQARRAAARHRAAMADLGLDPAG